MYELKKIGKVFTSKFFGTGPSSCEKKVEKHCLMSQYDDRTKFLLKSDEGNRNFT